MQGQEGEIAVGGSHPRNSGSEANAVTLPRVRGVPLAGEVLGSRNPLLQFLEPVLDQDDLRGRRVRTGVSSISQ